MKQRAADFIGMFAAIIIGTAYGGPLGFRLLLSAAVAVLGAAFLRLALRVPVWRNPPDERPENLPPYGEASVR